MIISSVDQVPVLDAAGLVAAIAREFGEGAVRLGQVSSSYAEYRVAVDAPGEPPCAVSRLTGGSLALDGTLDQDCRAAAAIRASLPADFPRVVAIRDDGSEYVDLVPGITPADIALGWRDVAEGGF